MYMSWRWYCPKQMARRIRFCGAKPYDEDVMKQMALSLRNGVGGGVSKLSIDRNRKYLDDQICGPCIGTCHANINFCVALDLVGLIYGFCKVPGGA